MKFKEYFSWKTSRKEPLWRPKRRRDDNITMDVRKVQCLSGADCSVQWRSSVNTAMNFRIP